MNACSRLLSALAILALPLAACKSMGEGNGVKSAVDRRYAKTPDEVSRAAAEAFQELGIAVQSDVHDALGGQVTAQRNTPDKEKVVVTYKSLDARNTQVTVTAGKEDRQAAELIQDRLAEKLGAASAMSIPHVGAASEAVVDPPVPQCLTAAEQALRDLKMGVTRKETHDTWAEVESREADAIPVAVRMERTEKDKTRVTVTAGTSRSQDTQQLADRVRAEFEKKLGHPEAK